MGQIAPIGEQVDIVDLQPGGTVMLFACLLAGVLYGLPYTLDLALST